MFQHALVAFRSVLLLFLFLFSFSLPAAAATDARLSESYGRLPLQFEANQGQTHEDVRFLARGPGYGLYLTAGEAVLVLARPNPDAKRDAHGARTQSNAQVHEKPVALRMSLVGAARKPLVSGIDELPGKANYFIGKDRAKWRTNVPTYEKVHYREVYPGIDLVYYGNQRQLEYDFVVAPGADPEKIVLDFTGADKLEIDAEGNLVLHAAGGNIRQHKPVIYQETDGVRTEIEGRYALKGANRVGFRLAAYDRSRPLVIDPVVLSYATYLGGIGLDVARGIAVDASGNAYVTGSTNSINFPTTLLAFQLVPGSPVPPNPDDAYDAFVTKLNPQGTALVYSTFLGGGDRDSGVGLAVDSDGNAYVTGFTRSTNFPTTQGAFQTTYTDAGYFQAFVTKVSPSGSALVYSTYLGGTAQGSAGRWHDDEGFSIAVDAARNAYVTGYTNSNDFPTTPGAFQSAFFPGAYHNAFVTKLNPTGSTLVYSTFLGGNVFEYGSGITVDASGSAYVVGTTQSSIFPTTAGAFQRTFLAGGGRPGYSTLFVTKVDPAGSALTYSTYLGGTFNEGGGGIAVNASGNAYVAGRTHSTDFPTTPGAFQPTIKGYSNAFVTQLNPTGASLVYSTYLGGGCGEGASGIAVDATGNAYVTGSTCSTDFPTTAGAFQRTFNGRGPDDSDAFVTKLDSTGSALVYSSYLGGNGWSFGEAVAVSAGNIAYLTGSTRATNFPTTPSSFQINYGGGSYDAFIVKVVDEVPSPAAR